MRMRFKPYAHDELMAADFHVHEPLIWGGKWHRFDIMHFEYRPEIILQAKKKAVKAEPCIPVRESGSGAEKNESAPLPE